MNPSKQVCQLNSNNIFVGTAIADLCQITESVYLLPAGCIDTEPPPAQIGYVAQWKNQTWHYITDLRGQTAYEKNTGAEIQITELGELPHHLTLIKKPDQYYEWNDATGAWETNADLQAAKLSDWRNSVAEITPKQLRLVLLENGINAKTVEAAIAAIPDDTTREIAGIEWNYATGYARTNENLIMIATDLLGLDALKIDAMWQAALLK